MNALQFCEKQLASARIAMKEWERQYTILETDFVEKVKQIPGIDRAELHRLEKAVCALKGDKS